jgi:hypothetical protein
MGSPGDEGIDLATGERLEAIGEAVVAASGNSDGGGPPLKCSGLARHSNTQTSEPAIINTKTNTPMILRNDNETRSDQHERQGIEEREAWIS